MSQGPTPLERFVQGILPENPVYRQLLGLCPTLAVTNSMKAAVTMAGAVMFVLFCANVITSLIRNLLKPHLRKIYLQQHNQLEDNISLYFLLQYLKFFLMFQ